jgi:hypothetical protein
VGSIGKTIITAAASALELVKTQPLGPQLRARLERADARRTSLKAEVDALALDAELGEPHAIERQRELQAALSKAAAECDRLQAAYETALARDQRAENEVEIAAAEAKLREYEKIAAARLAAAQDFEEASRLSKAAARRLLAANDLLKTELPFGCKLPPGLTVGGREAEVLASVDAVRVENEHVVASVRKQVRAMAAVRRGERGEEAA